jgi:hypothetical protein
VEAGVVAPRADRHPGGAVEVGGHQRQARHPLRRQDRRQDRGRLVVIGGIAGTRQRPGRRARRHLVLRLLEPEQVARLVGARLRREEQGQR